MREYLPIESHGVIGNLETVALVGLDGTIDFMCFPHFDSPSHFSSLLDASEGGFFRVAPKNKDYNSRQMYFPDSNVLITRFHLDEGILEVIDFMPIGDEFDGKELVRIVKAVTGNISVTLDCKTTFDYQRIETKVDLENDGYSALFSCENSDIKPTRLDSSVELNQEGNLASSLFTLNQGEEAYFSYLCDAKTEHNPLDRLPKALQKTNKYWQEWVKQCQYQGVWQDNVRRSVLVLKLLFSNEHGSMVAAPTFGLPESVGGERNWDYRYCWIRDSSFTVFALLKAGFNKEALSYVNWVTDRYSDCDSHGLLNLMYRIDGTNHIDESELRHFDGYKGSKPVRIGNAANGQFQLDIYGELIDSIYLANKNGLLISIEIWQHIVKTVNYVLENWHLPDEGIWEFRGQKKQFLHSKLMCWVAIDRAMRISERNSLPAPNETWRAVRDEIYQEIITNYWNEERQTFTQYKGGATVDASTLMMPMVKFISPFDPKWKSTLKALNEDLVTDVFVKRYQPDEDLENLDDSEEGSFTMCSFWHCEILARSGQVEFATLLFEKMLGYANHLGLYSEEIGRKGEHLGNFPQAFTHLALISAAIAIGNAKSN